MKLLNNPDWLYLLAEIRSPLKPARIYSWIIGHRTQYCSRSETRNKWPKFQNQLIPCKTRHSLTFFHKKGDRKRKWEGGHLPWHDINRFWHFGQENYSGNSTRLAKVASYKTSKEITVSCTQLVEMYAPFKFGSEHNFLGAGEFLAGTFKRVRMTVIKGQDLKW